MAAIKSRNTQPEMAIRHMLHRAGYRYRLHVKNLPGHPDIVFPARRKIIEVRGCFWHRHSHCIFATTPASNEKFWRSKFAATVERDARNLAALRGAGWQVMVVWECETADADMPARLREFLGIPGYAIDRSSFLLSTNSNGVTHLIER